MFFASRITKKFLALVLCVCYIVYLLSFKSTWYSNCLFIDYYVYWFILLYYFYMISWFLMSKFSSSNTILILSTSPGFIFTHFWFSFQLKDKKSRQSLKIGDLPGYGSPVSNPSLHGMRVTWVPGSKSLASDWKAVPTPTNPCCWRGTAQFIGSMLGHDQNEIQFQWSFICHHISACSHWFLGILRHSFYTFWTNWYEQFQQFVIDLLPKKNETYIIFVKFLSCWCFLCWFI